MQRNLTDANAWYELGVKQQENEREKKALQALERALEIDPSYLPAWLALAVSHTNDSNRIGAIEALRQWVFHNTKYGATVKAFLAQSPERPEASQSDRFSHLAECLMSMARSGATGEVDADIQIALAVLFNTNEVSLLSITFNNVTHSRILGLQQGSGLFPHSIGCAS